MEVRLNIEDYDSAKVFNAVVNSLVNELRQKLNDEIIKTVKESIASAFKEEIKIKTQNILKDISITVGDKQFDISGYIGFLLNQPSKNKYSYGDNGQSRILMLIQAEVDRHSRDIFTQNIQPKMNEISTLIQRRVTEMIFNDIANRN